MGFYSFIGIKEYKLLNFDSFRKDQNITLTIRKPELPQNSLMYIYLYSNENNATGLYCVVKVLKIKRPYKSSYDYSYKVLEISKSQPLTKLGRHLSLRFSACVASYDKKNIWSDYDYMTSSLIANPLELGDEEEIKSELFPDRTPSLGKKPGKKQIIEYHGICATSKTELYTVLFPFCCPSTISSKIARIIKKSNCSWIEALDVVYDVYYSELCVNHEDNN